MATESTQITQYLQDWRNGNASALDEILPVVYDELRKIARRYRAKERGEHTLQTTEIINEAYLKLLNQNENDWQDRTHFFAVASRVMRNLLVDYARTKNYQKRGSGAEKVSLEDVALFTPEPDEKILALDEALTRLAKFDERKSKLVELRYFGGLSALETAEVLGVSEITIKREWLKAKAWLYSELSQKDNI
ncbi:MAG TPA: sigma-70 family RNA polymerase sigma factor [Pyrinomonadaceae bacterium]|nr:sigma-70 family RNA polymerase sigma factor [Pyrinomonadaceae bacterium]